MAARASDEAYYAMLCERVGISKRSDIFKSLNAIPFVPKYGNDENRVMDVKRFRALSYFEERDTCSVFEVLAVFADSMESYVGYFNAKTWFRKFINEADISGMTPEQVKAKYDRKGMNMFFNVVNEKREIWYLFNDYLEKIGV